MNNENIFDLCNLHNCVQDIVSYTYLPKLKRFFRSSAQENIRSVAARVSEVGVYCVVCSV